MPDAPKYRIEAPYYPIAYVRGFSVPAMGDLENTFHDAYYGFSATSVEKRDAPAPAYFAIDIFEGQLIRFMKEAHSYVDASNEGLRLSTENPALNPARSIWISRFYDQDFVAGKLRSITDHAKDLQRLVCEQIPSELKQWGVDLGPGDKDYKVILLAHSMGGLVCRTLIQNLLPSRGEDPKRWVYRLVTMGTPHKGIDLGAVPDLLEKLVASTWNPFDIKIFQEKEMRRYLKLKKEEELHSLGGHFPPARCLCIIGSDYHDYTLVQKATGSFSDGLVKQDRAYIKDAYYANIHRAHSGFRGIVNSYESYENMRRFLFGDTRVDITLEDPKVLTPATPGASYFYDFEFLATIRKTGVYLHRREQDPCENAERIDRSKLPGSLRLHTAFMDSRLRDPGQPFSHFALTLRVLEHRVEQGFLGLWDREYPERPIYNETLEIRVGDSEGKVKVQYRWLSEAGDWQDAVLTGGAFRFPLRAAGSFEGTLSIIPGAWPGAD